MYKVCAYFEVELYPSHVTKAPPISRATVSVKADISTSIQDARVQSRFGFVEVGVGIFVL